jgi:predicted HicB family RNase H-like nuclease
MRHPNKRVTLRIPKEIYDQAVALVRSADTDLESLNHLVNVAVRNYLKHLRDPIPPEAEVLRKYL